MKSTFNRSALVLAVAIPLSVSFSLATPVQAQDNKPDSKVEEAIRKYKADKADATTSPEHPTALQLYSKDGRESLSATCAPIESHPLVSEVECKFVNARFVPPLERPGVTAIPLSVEEALATDPSLAEEVTKDPEKFERELRKLLEEAKQDFCSSSSESRIAIEAKIRAPAIGPKRKSYLTQLLAACADNDPTILFRRLIDLERRTCDLFVDQFTLEFKKVREGQWLYRQEAPGRLSKVLKIYELTGSGYLWTLTETRVPTKGAEEEPNQTVWSSRNFREYELPCEFISHGLVQLP